MVPAIVLEKCTSATRRIVTEWRNTGIHVQNRNVLPYRQQSREQVLVWYKVWNMCLEANVEQPNVVTANQCSAQRCRNYAPVRTSNVWGVAAWGKMLDHLIMNVIRADSRIMWCGIVCCFKDIREICQSRKRHQSICSYCASISEIYTITAVRLVRFHSGSAFKFKQNVVSFNDLWHLLLHQWLCLTTLSDIVRDVDVVNSLTSNIT